MVTDCTELRTCSYFPIIHIPTSLNATTSSHHKHAKTGQAQKRPFPSLNTFFSLDWWGGGSTDTKAESFTLHSIILKVPASRYISTFVYLWNNHLR